MRSLRVVAGAVCLSGCSLVFAVSDDAASGARPDLASDAGAENGSENGATTDGDGGSVELLREGLASPDSLIVDETSLMWIEPGTPGRVVRVPLDQWPNETVLASGQKNPYRAIEYGGVVYWTTRDDGQFHRFDNAAGDVAYGGATEIGDLAGAGNAIFFAYNYNGSGSLQKCSPTECFPGAAIYYPENLPLQQLRSTSIGLAWIEGLYLHAASTSDVSAQGGVYGVTGDAAGIATFASDADYFYVAGKGGGIVSLPLTAHDDAGKQTVLADARVVTSLASDGTSLFLASADGRISAMRRLPDSGAPIDVAHSTRGPVRSLVISRDYVYWSEGDAILRVRKSSP